MPLLILHFFFNKLFVFLEGVGIKQLSEVKALAPFRPRGVTPSSLRPTPSPETDLDNSLNSSQLMNLEAQQCSQRRCTGNGHCVEMSGVIACVCSEGYTGDFCQDHLIKNMQGPIIYGVVGLCAAVVVIAVIAVVAKKRSANSRLFTLFARNTCLNFGFIRQMGMMAFQDVQD